MIIELVDPKSFSEGVGQILFLINLFQLDIISIHDFMDKMIASHNVFGSVVWLGLFYLHYDSSTITI